MAGDGRDPEYEEIRLVDIVRVIHRRKVALGVVVFLSLLGGIAVTALATPEYESTATIIPLEFSDIIANWLSSRHAAEVVIEDLGGRVEQSIFADRWDAGTQTWTGSAPSRDDAARQLAGNHIEIENRVSGRTNERFITVTASFSDPILARDVANAYVGTLSALRPHLENITRQEAFDKYYDGQNEQQAQQRAEVAARQKVYWIYLDSAILANSPARPNAALNIAVAAVLGVVLGILAVIFLEWLGNYRAEARKLEFNSDEETQAPPAPPPPRRFTAPRAR